MKNMKNLYLIRHAKASWDDPHLQDFDRPLTELGVQDAHLIGKELKKLKTIPDAVISSPAVRSIATAEIMAKELGFPVKKIIKEAVIYNGGAEEMIELIKAWDNKINTLFFFGHNPTLTWLTHYLSDEAKMNVPTCGVVGINFSMKTWSHLSDAESKLITFLHPEHEHIQGAI